MKIVENIDSLKKELNISREKNLKVGFVPTMGALHAGHISLIKKAKQTCDVVVVSIFVNPAQFGPKEDLDQYPRNIETDAKFCKDAGVDIVFVPQEQEIYPITDDTLHISYPKYTTRLCGSFRPGHFDGVLLVMTKLLNIVDPDVCFMGMKDGQQLILIEKLVQDLELDIKVEGCSTLREESGLAMSSRNSYLSESERNSAEKVNEALDVVVSKHIADLKTGIEIQKAYLQDNALIIQYFELVNRENLESVSKVEQGPYMLCIAVLCGDTRLIDNYFIDVESTGEIKIDKGTRITNSQ